MHKVIFLNKMIVLCVKEMGILGRIKNSANTHTHTHTHTHSLTREGLPNTPISKKLGLLCFIRISQNPPTPPLSEPALSGCKKGFFMSKNKISIIL